MEPLPASEVALVRDLARQVATLAQEPRMAAIRRRWADVNALRQPDRAPVWCRPVECWKELVPPASLVCQHPWLREIECGFRQVLIKRQIDDDSPVEPWFAVPAAWVFDPPNLWGVDTTHCLPDREGGSWAFNPPLKNASDFDRLRLPAVAFDDARTRARLERAQELLGDILPVRLTAAAPLGATLGTAAADLRGLEQIMMDMIDAPELAHRLMAHLRDATMQVMDQVEAMGILTPNHYGPMIGSDPFGPGGGEGRCGFRNQWGQTNSQEFDQVSPAMWEEFCLTYQRPILARYGRVAYGCCENLTHKLEGVLSIPNLRIVVCSAWTNLDVLLDRVGTDYCVMWRQKASDVVFAPALDAIGRHLESGLQRLQGRRYQIVLRELQTLAGHPDRLHSWTSLAKNLAAQYS